MMMNKNKKSFGVVYSTNKSFDYLNDEESEEATLAPNDQDLRVLLERKKEEK